MFCWVRSEVQKDKAITLQDTHMFVILVRRHVRWHLARLIILCNLEGLERAWAAEWKLANF